LLIYVSIFSRLTENCISRPIHRLFITCFYYIIMHIQGRVLGFYEANFGEYHFLLLNVL